MRILFVATALDMPEAYLVRGLLERGVDVRLLLSSESKHTKVLEEFRQRVTRISLKNRIDIGAMKAIRSVLREFNPDIVHSLSARALSNSLFASWGIAVEHVAYRGTMGNLSYWDPSSLISFLHPRLRKIICVSDAVRKDLAKLGVATDKLIRIYKGHDPAWYGIDKLVRKADLGIASDQLVISCVANSRPVKGIDTLIRAFQLIPESLPVHLLLVGEVRDSSLQQIAGSNPRIHFLGFRNDAPAIVAGSDVFCMPSRRREGFPKALLEAMIQGVPGVVTDVGGLPEMVINNHNGLVVQGENPAVLSEALIKMVTDGEFRERAGKNARQRVIEEFPVKATIEQTLGVYRELLEDNAVKQ